MPSTTRWTIEETALAVIFDMWGIYHGIIANPLADRRAGIWTTWNGGVCTNTTIQTHPLRFDGSPTYRRWQRVRSLLSSIWRLTASLAEETRCIPHRSVLLYCRDDAMVLIVIIWHSDTVTSSERCQQHHMASKFLKRMNFCSAFERKNP
jgi:hypothetical protein